MKQPSRFGLLFVSFIAVVLVGSLFYSLGQASQEDEKALNIERYPNEPLELVDIKIGEKSIKEGIKIKSRDNISKWGRDGVRFKENNGWFRHIRIRLRNVSGYRIFGLKAGLHFQPTGVRMLFSLPLTCIRGLDREPLEPGQEVDLEVGDQSFNRAIQRMSKYGVEPDTSLVTFSVDSAIFNDDLMWYRGSLLRRDPNKMASLNRQSYTRWVY